MAQVYVKYNPYRLQTEIKYNGNPILEDNDLYKFTKGKRLQEWIGKFPKKLRDAYNTAEFSLKFYGTKLDFDDFKEAFEQAKKERFITVTDLEFIEGKSDEDINEKIVAIFKELQASNIDDFKDRRLEKAFENVNNSIFPINVIATMSSGKSTLINALLGKKLMPYKNEACTATITEILDTDEEQFRAVVYNADNEPIEEVPNLTFDIMSRLNDDENVHHISAEGNIPFLDTQATALKLIDTPGPNNARNQEHKNTTYRAINSDSNNLILYVLNGTQLSTNDDASLLNFVAEQMKSGGKQVRDRFLFVVNKMDAFNPEEESIESVIVAIKNYLAGYGIEDPQIFPCSAYTALNIRTELGNVDIDNLTREQMKKLPIAAKDTIPFIDKFNEYEQMFLEKYSTLAPSTQEELNYRLTKAMENSDTKEQALIHCGICSIEAAITAYVKKYAKTKKIKDLVESFQEVLVSNEVLTKAKMQIANDEKMAKECSARIAAVQKKIEDGEDAKIFKQRILDLNPISKIEEKVNQLKQVAASEASRIFSSYGEIITNKQEAVNLIKRFTESSSNSLARLTAELESLINGEIVETGERILFEYQDKISKIDESSVNDNLDFKTLDLIKGALTSIRENADSWTSDDFVTGTVDDVSETSYEERTYYEKVGEEEVIIGHHKEKVGTRKVLIGTHTEKAGTRKVRNPKKEGIFGWFKFWQPDYIEEDVYETVEDYKDEDIFETVTDYGKRDKFEERKERIEKFQVSVAKIQTGLVAKMREALDDGSDNALCYATNQVEQMKEQFFRLFDKLDQIIQAKYEELKQVAEDKEHSEEHLKENQKLLSWIEDKMNAINALLDI